MTDIVSKKTTIVKRSVSFRISYETANELDQLRKRVKSAGKNVEFRLDDAVDKELVKLIKKANKQLDALDTGS